MTHLQQHRLQEHKLLKSVFKHSNMTYRSQMDLCGSSEGVWCVLLLHVRSVSVWKSSSVCVSSIKLEKQVGRGEALLLQTHYTHTGMEAFFLFFFFFLSFLNRHTPRLQLIPQRSRDRAGKKGVTHFTVKLCGEIFPSCCFYVCVLVSI